MRASNAVSECYFRTIPRSKAKAEIETLFSGGKPLYYSDIVRELRLELDIVVSLCRELIDEGKIGSKP